VDVLWVAGRGAFAIAAIAAVAAIALQSRFFRAPLGRAVLALSLLVALLPSDFHSAGQFAAELVPALLLCGWLGLSAVFLLRDSAAAWALFGLFARRPRRLEIVAQPAPADRAAGGLGTASPSPQERRRAAGRASSRRGYRLTPEFQAARAMATVMTAASGTAQNSRTNSPRFRNRLAG
jgi:hypothetical protein